VRFGVVGLGSMGSRRVRDLLALGHEVHGFDVRADRNRRAAERFQIRTVSSLSALLDCKLDALVLSTPPDQHVGGYRAAFDARLPFFSEASILTPTAEWFATRERELRVCGYPSATWRFYAPLVELERALKAPNAPTVTAVHHEYADYLPRWHPWESYWDFYAGARRETSAAREMVPFEFEWLCWLFGEVEEVSAVVARLGRWRTDINDSYFLHVRFVNGVMATVRIELHREAPARLATVCGAGGSYQLNFNAHDLQRYDSQSGAWAAMSVPQTPAASSEFEKVYEAEIAAFACAVAGAAEYPKAWADDRHLSNILMAAETSTRERRPVTLAEVACDYDGLSLE
jgi:predicted dehydrogenase